MNDELGKRIKEYEKETKFFVKNKAYHVIRLDGKAFHTYTKDLDRPFDNTFISIMNEVAEFLCLNIQGAKCAFVQSDEISILITDIGGQDNTQIYFDGNIQKIVSVTASMASAKFNEIANSKLGNKESLALFDSRIFTLPSYVEVINTFIWRQLDTIKNSIQMCARHHLGHKECQNKNTEELKSALEANNTPWVNCPLGFRQGRLVKKVYLIVPESTIEVRGVLIRIPEHTRTKWETIDCPIININSFIFRELIPQV